MGQSQPPDREPSLGDDAAEAWLSEVFAEVLRAPTAPAVGRERLVAATLELPLRYAPFFERLSALWALPVADVEAALSASRHGTQWQRALPGLRYFNVAERTPAGRARLLEFAPGFRFPEHRHGGEERVLVLEGSYADSNGDVVRAGDERRNAAGTSHALTIGAEGPCVAAILQPELDFLSPLGGRLLRRFSLRRRS